MSKYFGVVGFISLVCFVGAAIYELILIIGGALIGLSFLEIVIELFEFAVFAFFGPSLSILFISYAGHLDWHEEKETKRTKRTRYFNPNDYSNSEHVIAKNDSRPIFRPYTTFIDDFDMEIERSTIANATRCRLSDLSFGHDSIIIEHEEYEIKNITDVEFYQSECKINFKVNTHTFEILFKEKYLDEAMALYDYIRKENKA